MLRRLPKIGVSVGVIIAGAALAVGFYGALATWLFILLGVSIVGALVVWLVHHVGHLHGIKATKAEVIAGANALKQSVSAEVAKVEEALAPMGATPQP